MSNHRRVLPFRKLPNFRDLGGYPAADGRVVKWGVLYRSGHLAKLKGADQRRFESLGLHTLIDFRSEMEFEREPDRLPPGHKMRFLSLPILDSPRKEGSNTDLVKEIQERFESKDFSGFDPNEKMEATYRAFVTDFSDQFRGFIHAVLDAGGRPMLWHCTSGKDRTGYAAAITLRLLGVPEEIIIGDYLLSRRYADRRRGVVFFMWMTRGKEVARLIEGLMLVQEEWIRAALSTIDERWGSFANYTAQALELSPPQIQQLRDTLTTT